VLPRISEDSARQEAQARYLVGALELSIESYYLFAKILLDRVADFIEYYFGPARGIGLDSHDNLHRKIEEYCQAKDLKLRRQLLQRAEEMRRAISDVRDYQIAHEKSPRTLRAMAFGGAGNVEMQISRLFPREGEVPINTEDLAVLSRRLDAYLISVIRFIHENRDKAHPQLLNEVEPQEGVSSATPEPSRCNGLRFPH